VIPLRRPLPTDTVVELPVLLISVDEEDNDPDIG
jgi:hypothetical protein